MNNDPKSAKTSLIPPRRVAPQAPSEQKAEPKDSDDLAKYLGNILLQNLDAKKSENFSEDLEDSKVTKKFYHGSASKKRFMPSSPNLESRSSSVAKNEAANFASSDSPSSIPSRYSQRRKRGLLKNEVPISIALLVGIMAVAISGLFFYFLGARAAHEKTELSIEKTSMNLTPEIGQAIDGVLLDLQEGRAKEALEKIKLLQGSAPRVASLSSIAANAALLSKNLDLAEEYTQESLKERQSVSDALVIQAVIEALRLSDKNYTKIGDTKMRIETLLRESMAADPTSARPYLELAAMNRFSNRYDEALALLKSAQLRQSVEMDTTVTDTAIALLQLQMLGDEALPKLSENPSGDLQSLLCDAYTAMRMSDTSVAVSRLSQARERVSAKVFTKLLKDPAFSPYSKDAAFADFFTNKRP
jgi:hypothetical protein